MRAARAGAECASMSVEPHLDLGDAVRDRARVSASASRPRAPVGGQHPVDQAVLAARRLLRDVADAGVARHVDGRRSSGASSPAISRSSVVLPAPLRPTRPTLWPVGNADGGAFEDGAPFDAEGEIVDVQHGART